MKRAHEAIADAIESANRKFGLGIPKARERALSQARQVAVAGNKVRHVAYIDLPKASRRILTTKGAREHIESELRKDGMLTFTRGKRIYVAEKLEPGGMPTIGKGIMESVFKQHVAAQKDPRRFNIELQDHYVGVPITESNAIDLVHALHAAALTSGKWEGTVLFDDANFLNGGLLPEEVMSEHHMLTGFIHGYVKPDSYKLISESKLKKVYDSLNRLIGADKKGECPDYDALLYITKMGKKEEFAEKFAERHGVKKEDVLAALSELPDFNSTHAFISLPKVETLGGIDVNAKSQQQSTRERLESHGMGHLDENITRHLYNLKEMGGIGQRHFETILNPKSHSKEEIADAQLRILTRGKRGLDDVRQLAADAEAAEDAEAKKSDAADSSFWLHHLVRVLEAYPAVLKGAREGMDIEALPAYIHEMLAAHEKAKEELGDGVSDPRYRAAVSLAHFISKDILNWMGIRN